MGRSSEVKDRKNKIKVKCDGQTDRRTDGWTDRPTKRGVESRSTRLKIIIKGKWRQTDGWMDKARCIVVYIARD